MKRILRRVKMNLTKKFRKNLLKCVVFIILFSMLFTSLYIQNVSKNLENNIISKFDIYIEIDPNIFYSKVTQVEQKEQTIKYATIIEDIKNNTNTSFFDYSLLTHFKNPIKSISIENNEYIFYDLAGSYSANTNSVYYSLEEHDNKIQNFINGTYTIITRIKTTISEIPQDFELGNAELVKGRMFTEDEINNGENVCIINNKFASYSLEGAKIVNVGDVITISEVVQNENGEVIYYLPHEFKVIGTYEVAEGRKIQSDGLSTGESPIYIPQSKFKDIYESVAKKAVEYDSNYFSDKNARYELDNALFKVDTIKDYQEFLNYLEKYSNEFNNGYKFVSTMDEIYPAISNVLSISNTINYVSALCLIVCISITVLIIVFEMDACKKDIGILLSMGESIRGVLTQFVIEMLLISMLSAGLSFIVTQSLGTSVLVTVAKENITSDVLIEHNIDIAIESNEYDEILRPLTIYESIQSVAIYVIGIGVFQSGLIYIMIKKIDPKELMKDE